MTVTLIAFCLVDVLLAGCSNHIDSGRGPSRVHRGTAASLLARRVLIRNHAGADEFVFAPRSIAVRAGTRVTWVNQSAQPHTVTDSGRRPAFDSGTTSLIQPRQSWSHTFNRPGRYAYLCLLHPYMTAVVVVSP